MGFPSGVVVKNPSANAGDVRDADSIPGLGRSSGGGEWQPTPVFLPGEYQGQRSLAGYSPWGCKESDMTEKLTPYHKFVWTLQGERTHCSTVEVAKASACY